MQVLANSNHCVLVEKGGKCCEGRTTSNVNCYLPMIFGGLVLIGFIVLIVLQTKTLNAIHKNGKKK